MTRVYGLDISLTATGISDGTTTWLVKSTGTKDATLAERYGRLADLTTLIVNACWKHSDPTLVVVEAPAFGSQNGHMHDRSGLWWAVVSELHRNQAAVAEVPPAVLKKYAVGRGNANKGAMIEAATRRLPNVDTGGHDGRVDALWLAALGIDHLIGRTVVPQAHREALVKVRWPR